MKIEGLSEEQVEMLDFMWNELNTFEEFFEWYNCLDKDQQIMADALQRMVIMESIDEEIEELKTFPDAKKVLEKYYEPK